MTSNMLDKVRRSASAHRSQSARTCGVIFNVVTLVFVFWRAMLDSVSRV